MVPDSVAPETWAFARVAERIAMAKMKATEKFRSTTTRCSMDTLLTSDDRDPQSLTSYGTGKNLRLIRCITGGSGCHDSLGPWIDAKAPWRGCPRQSQACPSSSLPNHLERKLNVPGQHQLRLLQAPRALRDRPVRLEDLGVTAASKGQGHLKVGVIQDVEKLRPELHGEGLGNLPDRPALVRGEIHIVQIRTDNAIAAGIAQEIRATARNRGKSHALRCDRRSRHGYRETTGVDVSQEGTAFEIVVDGIASGKFIRNAECVGAAILRANNVPLDEGSGRNTA